MFNWFKTFSNDSSALNSGLNASLSAADSKNAALSIDQTFKTLGIYTSLTDLIRFQGPARRIDITRQKQAIRRSIGPHRARHKGRGMEFEDVRQYQAGDDIRHIDWRVTARVGQTHTKQFQEEREIPTLLVLDQRQSMFFGSKQCMKSVMACDLFSLIAWASLHRGDRVGGIIAQANAHHELRPKKSRKSVLSLLQKATDANTQLSVNAIEPSQKSNDTNNTLMLSELLLEVKRVAKPGSQVFFISDFQDFDDSCTKALRDLSLHCQCTFIHVFDQLENSFVEQLAKHNSKESLWFHNGQQLEKIDGSNRLQMSSYQEDRQQRNQLLQQALNKYQINQVDAEASENPLKLMQQHFMTR